MSSLKVMPASSKVMPASEPKPGKIYATMEQKKTLMAIYEADNYPDSSMLEQVVGNEDGVISKIRIQPIITMFYVSKIAQTNRVQLCVGFPRAWLQSRLGKAMVHVHQVGIFFKNIEEILGNEIEKTNFFRKVMRKQGKEPVQSNKQDKVNIDAPLDIIQLIFTS